ncbi:hypothetical protein LY76DRAFT_255326 [Colletotrichum caudatum]|nr:hypothetical protein LY76DRAFT_255326 [Colletotrichum caudatum]
MRVSNHENDNDNEISAWRPDSLDGYQGLERQSSLEKAAGSRYDAEGASWKEATKAQREVETYFSAVVSCFLLFSFIQGSRDQALGFCLELTWFCTVLLIVRSVTTATSGIGML